MARGLDVSQQLNKGIDTCECFFIIVRARKGHLKTSGYKSVYSATVLSRLQFWDHLFHNNPSPQSLLANLGQAQYFLPASNH